MTDPRSDLERESRRFVQPDRAFERLTRRRADKRLHQRITAGIVGILVFVAVALGTWVAVERDTAKVPADEPSPSDLGIFAGVRGWIVYGDLDSGEPGIWAIDPTNPVAQPILLDVKGGGLPVAWSSDGTTLLILRGNRWGPGPAELVVLHADGSETRVTRSVSLGYPGGSFTPDGSQVVYGATGGIHSVSADGGSPRLLYAGDGVYQPALSPDGTRLAFFEGHGDAENRLWVMNVDGTDKRQIVGVDEAGRTPWTLQWSPDGTRLAFTTSGARSVGIVNADGSGSLAFVDAGVEGTGPYWSPDGSHIAFGSGQSLTIGRPDGTELQEFSAGGAGPWNPLEPAPAEDSTQDQAAPLLDLGIFAPVAGWIVYGDQDGIWGVDPATSADPTTSVHLTTRPSIPLGWSSDGTRLLIQETISVPGGPYTSRLVVLNADGSKVQVAGGGANVAALSPDGTRVVFAGEKGFYGVGVGDGRPAVLLAERDGVEATTFSPDGTQIAYVVGAGDHDHSVWVMNADGRNAHQILSNEATRSASHVRGLTWSPAGDRIAYGNDQDAYTFAPDGSGFTQVHTYATWPYWSPDGSQIALSAPEDFPSRLIVADADGSDVATTISEATSGPWNPAPRGAS